MGSSGILGGEWPAAVAQVPRVRVDTPLCDGPPQSPQRLDSQTGGLEAPTGRLPDSWIHGSRGHWFQEVTWILDPGDIGTKGLDMLPRGVQMASKEFHLASRAIQMGPERAQERSRWALNGSLHGPRMGSNRVPMGPEWDQIWALMVVDNPEWAEVGARWAREGGQRVLMGTEGDQVVIPLQMPGQLCGPH